MTWESDLDRAARANHADPMVRAFAKALRANTAPTVAPQVLTAWVRRLPYRFDGERHRIASLRTCFRRGYGACADAAALVAAVAKLNGEDAAVCYERVDSLPDYAHVRAVWRGWACDPWPERSFAVDECALVIRVLRDVR